MSEHFRFYTAIQILNKGGKNGSYLSILFHKNRKEVLNGNKNL